MHLVVSENFVKFLRMRDLWGLVPQNVSMTWLGFRRLACLAASLLLVCCSDTEDSVSDSLAASEDSVASDTTILKSEPLRSATTTTAREVAVLLDSDDPTLALDHTTDAPMLDALLLR